MSGPNTRYEALARKAADRITAAAKAGEQLTFLADEPKRGDAPARRGPGKALSQMRKWLEARGYRLPEDVLAEMAGLATSQDAVLEAMTKAERILAWAQAGDLDGKTPTMAMRVNLFMQVYTVQLRAAEALLPYGAPKATPDVNVAQAVQIVMPAAPGDGATVVNQAARAPVGRSDVAPPPLPKEIEQNQPLADADPTQSDAQSRTKGPSR